MATSLSSKFETLSTSEIDVVVAVVQWLDLPEALIEKILERLSIPGYIRFGAVCRRWRSIQRAHRLRHSPTSPPTISLPWFIPYRPRRQSVRCPIGLLLSEVQRLHIPFSSRYLSFLALSLLNGTERTKESSVCYSLPYGCLLLHDLAFHWSGPRSYEFNLLNPITDVHIQLPNLGDTNDDFKATISPPPHCHVFTFTAHTFINKLHLCRWGNPYWNYVWCDKSSGVPMAMASVIYYEGKFYCIRLGKDFMVFDIDCPVEDQIKPRYLEMDQTLLPKGDRPWPDYIEDSLEIFLVESNGKMLLVCKFYVYHPSHTIRRLLSFKLFEADLSNMRWVMAEDLGDQALIIYRNFVVSLVAADVGVKQNCIYTLDPPRKQDKPTPWNMFELSTGKVADALLPIPPSPSTHLMFMPSIY